jgi:hypothetical protein
MKKLFALLGATLLICVQALQAQGDWYILPQPQVVLASHTGSMSSTDSVATYIDTVMFDSVVVDTTVSDAYFAVDTPIVINYPSDINGIINPAQERGLLVLPLKEDRSIPEAVARLKDLSNKGETTPLLALVATCNRVQDSVVVTPDNLEYFLTSLCVIKKVRPQIGVAFIARGIHGGYTTVDYASANATNIVFHNDIPVLKLRCGQAAIYPDQRSMIDGANAYAKDFNRSGPTISVTPVSSRRNTDPACDAGCYGFEGSIVAQNKTLIDSIYHLKSILQQKGTPVPVVNCLGDEVSQNTCLCAQYHTLRGMVMAQGARVDTVYIDRSDSLGQTVCDTTKTILTYSRRSKVDQQIADMVLDSCTLYRIFIYDINTKNVLNDVKRGSRKGCACASLKNIEYRHKNAPKTVQNCFEKDGSVTVDILAGYLDRPYSDNNLIGYPFLPKRRGVRDNVHTNINVTWEGARLPSGFSPAVRIGTGVVNYASYTREATDSTDMFNVDNYVQIGGRYVGRNLTVRLLAGADEVVTPEWGKAITLLWNVDASAAFGKRKNWIIEGAILWRTENFVTERVGDKDLQLLEVKGSAFYRTNNHRNTWWFGGVGSAHKIFDIHPVTGEDIAVCAFAGPQVRFIRTRCNSQFGISADFGIDAMAAVNRSGHDNHNSRNTGLPWLAHVRVNYTIGRPLAETRVGW